jgi:hypothetical protein
MKAGGVGLENSGGLIQLCTTKSIREDEVTPSSFIRSGNKAAVLLDLQSWGKMVGCEYSLLCIPDT